MRNCRNFLPNSLTLLWTICFCAAFCLAETLESSELHQAVFKEVKATCNCEVPPQRTLIQIDLNGDSEPETIRFSPSEPIDDDIETQRDIPLLGVITNSQKTRVEFFITDAFATDVMDINAWKLPSREHILLVQTLSLAWKTAPLKWSCAFHLFAIDPDLTVTPLLELSAGYHYPEGQKRLDESHTALTPTMKEDSILFLVHEEREKGDLAPDGGWETTVTTYSLLYDEQAKVLKKSDEHKESVIEP